MAGDQILGHLPATFPGALEGAVSEVEQLGLEPASKWDAGTIGCDLMPCATIPAAMRPFLRQGRDQPRTSPLRE